MQRAGCSDHPQHPSDIPGAGGSHAFADPENKIAFAYVMNQMEQSVLPNEKSLRLGGRHLSRRLKRDAGLIVARRLSKL